LQQNCGVLQSPATLGVSAVRLSSQPLLAGIKHLNRLEQVLAASRAREQGVDEALMQDQNGHLVSVIAGNIFLLSGKELLTPVLIDAGVRGTRRRLVLEQWAPAIGLNLHEAVLTLADLETADEVFYSNSLTGLRPVATVNKRRWSSHEVCQQLFQQYREECP
jgi:4-amino-4-deoxychorismate lyase